MMTDETRQLYADFGRNRFFERVELCTQQKRRFTSLSGTTNSFSPAATLRHQVRSMLCIICQHFLSWPVSRCSSIILQQECPQNFRFWTMVFEAVKNIGYVNSKLQHKSRTKLPAWKNKLNGATVVQKVCCSRLFSSSKLCLRSNTYQSYLAIFRRLMKQYMETIRESSSK